MNPTTTPTIIPVVELLELLELFDDEPEVTGAFVGETIVGLKVGFEEINCTLVVGLEEGLPLG